MYAQRWRVILLAICCSGCEDASDRCERLTKKVIDRIETECSISSPGCGGNPDLDRPVVMYTKHHHEEVQDVIRDNCPAPDLGVAPFLCNTAGGSPECPEGYQCCSVGGEAQCRSDCRDGGVGPDVGPRPDRGVEQGTENG